MERVHQGILNRLVTKYNDKKVLDHIDTWVETLASIAWEIRASYQRTIMDTPGQDVFGRDMLLNLVSVLYWKFVTSENQRQVYIYNVRENSRQVAHDYAIGDQVYAEMTGIYRKLDYNKQGPYIITELFTNGTVQVQQVQANEQINIIWLKHNFYK